MRKRKGKPVRNLVDPAEYIYMPTCWERRWAVIYATDYGRDVVMSEHDTDAAAREDCGEWRRRGLNVQLRVICSAPVGDPLSLPIS